MQYYDTHIHSYRSFVGAPDMTLENISRITASLGVSCAAVTDHLMKPEDVEGLRLTGRDIRAFNERNPQTPLLYGVEVCEVDASGATLLTKELKDELGFDLVIGGVHETHCAPGASLEAMALEQHRHHMMMMRSPLIEILVHPWWLDKDEFARLGIPWPRDLSFLSRDLTAELARASKDTHTYIEISTMSGLCNCDTSRQFHEDLVEYYRLLNQEGAYFSIGTDAHAPDDLSTVELARELIEKCGIQEERMYRYHGKQGKES